MFAFVSFILVCLITLRVSSVEGKKKNSDSEVTCVSQFQYDYKTLMKVTEIEHAQNVLKQSLADQEQKTHKLTEKVICLHNQHVNNVAFTAKITHEYLTGLKTNDPVIFNYAMTNYGNGYDVTTGIFEAPVGGMYVFNMDIMVPAGQRQYTQLIMNGEPRMPNFADGVAAKYRVSSSRTLTLRVSTGDRIWIAVAGDGGDGVIYGNGHSSFSGWLQTPIP